MKYDLKRLRKIRVFTDLAFAVCCASLVAAAALLGALAFVTAPPDESEFFRSSAGSITSFFISGEGIESIFQRLIALYSDRVFTGKFNALFVTDNYLKVGLWYSLALSVLAALSAFFCRRAAGSALFDNQPLSHSMAKTVRLSALFSLLCGIIPTVLKYFLVYGKNDMKVLFHSHGLALAVILYAASIIIDGGSDLVPNGLTLEEGSGKTTAASRMHQNAGMLAGLLPAAAVGCAAAVIFLLFRCLPLLARLGDNVLIAQDGGDMINSVLLGTVEEAEYTPLSLLVRFGYELASVILAMISLIHGIKALKGLRKNDGAFSAQTAKSFSLGALFALISSCVIFAGSLACYFMTGVRFTVPVWGLLCAAGLLVCSWLSSLCARLQEEKDRLKIEAEDDISDLSFVLH